MVRVNGNIKHCGKKTLQPKGEKQWAETVSAQAKRAQLGQLAANPDAAPQEQRPSFDADEIPEWAAEIDVGLMTENEARNYAIQKTRQEAKKIRDDKHDEHGEFMTGREFKELQDELQEKYVAMILFVKENLVYYTGEDFRNRFEEQHEKPVLDHKSHRISNVKRRIPKGGKARKAQSLLKSQAHVRRNSGDSV